MIGYVVYYTYYSAPVCPAANYRVESTVLHGLVYRSEIIVDGLEDSLLFVPHTSQHQQG